MPARAPLRVTLVGAAASVLAALVIVAAAARGGGDGAPRPGPRDGVVEAAAERGGERLVAPALPRRERHVSAATDAPEAPRFARIRAAAPDGVPIRAVDRVEVCVAAGSHALPLEVEAGELPGESILHGLPPREVVIAVHAEGHAPATTRVWPRGDGAPFEVTLRPSAPFTLQVVDPAGRPIEGARARTHRGAPPLDPGEFAERLVVEEVRTDGAGFARLTRSLGPGGASELCVEADDHSAHFRARDGFPLRVVLGDATDPWEILVVDEDGLPVHGHLSLLVDGRIHHLRTGDEPVRVPYDVTDVTDARLKLSGNCTPAVASVEVGDERAVARGLRRVPIELGGLAHAGLPVRVDVLALLDGDWGTFASWRWPAPPADPFIHLPAGVYKVGLHSGEAHVMFDAEVGPGGARFGPRPDLRWMRLRVHGVPEGADVEIAWLSRVTGREGRPVRLPGPDAQVPLGEHSGRFVVFVRSEVAGRVPVAEAEAGAEVDVTVRHGTLDVTTRAPAGCAPCALPFRITSREPGGERFEGGALARTMTDDGGTARLTLPAGRYGIGLRSEGGAWADPVAVDVAAGGTSEVVLGGE